MKDLEIQLDLDSFVQIFEESSRRPTQEDSAQTSRQPETSRQGKYLGSKSISEELTQIDTSMGNPPVL